MKKHIFFLLLCLAAMLLAAATLTAQQPKIDLRHAGTSTIFTDINAALTASVNGDTIYLPGGFFPGFTIDKGIAVIGVGHHPDSTVVTMRTQVNGSIEITPLADNCLLSGVTVNGIFFSGTTATSGFEISRCRIVNSINLAQNPASNGLIRENVIGGIIYSGFTNGQNLIISNNILVDIRYVDYSTITNNIFWNDTNSSYPFSGVDYSVIKNSISRYDYSQTYAYNSYFYNNLNLSTNGVNNSGSGNIPNVDFSTLFVQYTAPWDYTDDFHLTNPAYNTGGTDGTPIGIYGGMFPWKAGSVPFTPHINLKVIAPTTNAAGQLPITIRAKAQGN